MLKKIIVTGGDGRFAQELKKNKSKYNFVFRNLDQNCRHQKYKSTSNIIFMFIDYYLCLILY